MKKRIITALLALVLMVAIVPSNVLAGTTILDGTGTLTVTEQIVFVYTGTDGTYDPATNAWTVSSVGAGAKQFKITATNNGVGTTITALVNPDASPDGKVTAVWNSAAKYIAKDASYEFILTVTGLAGVANGSYPFAFSFTRP